VSAAPDAAIVEGEARALAHTQIDLWPYLMTTAATPERARLLRAMTLQHLLRSYASPPARGSVWLRRAARGAPQVRGAKLFTSTAHSEGLLLFAVARRPLGIDIEQIRRVPGARAIAQAFFAEAEARSWLDRGRGADVAFLEHWTRKESYLKARGEGFSVSAVAVNASADLAHGRVDHREDPLEALRWRVLTLRPYAGFVGALTYAVAGGEAQVRLHACRSLR
jgi:phosphopantetheinyl transferase